MLKRWVRQWLESRGYAVFNTRSPVGYAQDGLFTFNNDHFRHDAPFRAAYERGVRATLNLGHTFGHAIEQVSQYQVRHGEAVAAGMVAAANMAVELGRCDAALAARICSLLDRLGLPVSVSGYSVDAIHAAMAQDKKRAGKKLRFIIPQALGDVVMIDDPGEAVVRRAIETILV